MDKNTPEKNPSDPDQWDRDYLDRELEGSILEEIEEIPEVEGIRGSDRLQLLLFPLVALIIITGIPLFFGITTMNRNPSNIDRDFPFMSLESPLLRTAVRDINSKRRELDLKDIRIRRYQERVLELDNQLRVLQSVSEATLQIKELELLSEIDLIVSEERDRLRGLGRSDAQIDVEISKLKNGLDSEYEEKMDDFRNRELQVYQRRLADLKEERRQLNLALDTAVTERQDLARALEADEAQLLSELYRENDFIDLVNAGIDADLEILKESRQVENYWLNELASHYIGLMDAIGSRDRKRAGEHIKSLENLFTTTSRSEFPGMMVRNQADREIVRFLSAYVETIDQNGIEGLLAESRLLVDQATAHMAEGRYQEADIAWRRIGALWPMMDQVISGSTRTREELVGAEIRLYADNARASLTRRDLNQASSTWNAGLNRVPDPPGNEIQSFWSDWKKAFDARMAEQVAASMAALAMEKEDSAAAYNELASRESRLRREMAASAENERQALATQLEELNEELWESRTAAAARELEIARLTVEMKNLSRVSEVDRNTIEQMVPRSELVAAELRIAELERLVSELETRREDMVETAPPAGPVARWAPYGTILQVLDDSVIVEPLGTQIPAVDTRVRIMRSLGGDRAIHLADGVIVEADGFKAVIRLLSRSDGSESYSTPRKNDMIYLSAP